MLHDHRLSPPPTPDGGAEGDFGPGCGLHARLRARTDPAHRALEDALDWRARVATPEGYRALLARFHGFHAAWEAAIGRALADEALFGPRRRLGLAAADLAALGLPPGAIARLPAPPPPRLDGAGAAMGALYVLEGSTLGGQVVLRHVQRLHGPAAPCAYYRAHGPRTGAMWSAFRARLDALPTADAPAAEAAAVAAFEALTAWLCEEPGPAAA